MQQQYEQPTASTRRHDNMGISLDAFDKVISITYPTTEVTIQELVDAIRDWESELPNLGYDKVIKASGKEDLGDGVNVGITLELINDWRVQFEERPPPDYIPCKVSGGNLVATNIYGNNPIKPSAYTQVTISQSSSATGIETGGALTSEEHDKLMTGLETDIPPKVWDENISAHSSSGTFGEYMIKAKKWVGWLRSLI